MAGKLPRLQISVPIVDAQGKPTAAFQRFWQSAMEQIEARLGAVELAALNSAITGANAAAAAANTAADNAQATADSISSISALQGSFVSSDCVITGASSVPKITISAHTRLYGDGTSVAVSAGEVNPVSYDSLYYVYYDDLTRAGGAVTYQASTDSSQAGYTPANPGRHYVGAVKLPALVSDPDAVGMPNSQPIEILPPDIVDPALTIP